MAYAGDIIKESFNRTKSLFFPIRKKYWLKMGFISIMAGNSQGGNYNGNGLNDSNKSGFPSGMTLQQFIADLNTKALAFLSQYGYIKGIAFIVLYFIGLIFSYLSSMFTFVFIDGIVKKDIVIGKSFSEWKKQGISLFLFRLVVGLVSLFVTLAIFSPVIVAFFQNKLAYFNFWLLIPIILGITVYSTIVGIFMFLADDFAVPIMYMKKLSFTKAWAEFRKIASGKKGEIFLYWLIKIGLGIVAGIGSFVVVLILLIPLIAISLLGVLLYFGLKAIAGMVAAVIIIALLAVILLTVFIYFVTVVLVPVAVFFRIYSIEMVKKLQGNLTKR
jgi:hypothetical protein